MPRLDDTDPDVVDLYGYEGHIYVPIDLCADCYAAEDGIGGDAEHPPYEDQHPPYTCSECGVELTADDN